MSARNYFIVDLTKYMGYLPGLIGQVSQYVSSRYNSPSIGWFVRSDQAPFLVSTENVQIEFDPRARIKAVKDWILHLSQDGASDSIFHVMSLDGKLLAETSELNGPSLVVATHHLINHTYGLSKEAIPGRRTLSPPPGANFQVPRLLSLEEAVELTRRVLERDGHTSRENPLLLAKLRPRLIELDDRAQRVEGDSASITLIKQIVTAGQAHGWLGYDVGVPRMGNERIWLKTPAPITVPAAPAPARLPATTSNNGGPAEAAVKAVAESNGAAAPVPAAGEQIGLAKLMQSKLSKNRIGSPVMPREFLYAALKQVFAESNSQGISLSELIARARARAEQSAKESGYDRPQKWDAIAECFQKMLLEAQVLEDPDGNHITNRIGARASVVAKINPHLEDRCEALLVECIVREMGGVQYDDWHCYNIGLALYQRGREGGMPYSKLVERADFLLRILENEGRIEMNAERVMFCKKNVPTTG